MSIPAEIVVALMSAAVGIFGYHFGRRQATATAGNIDAQTIHTLRIELNEVVKDVANLRDEIRTKEDAIKQKDADITQLQAQVNKLESRLTKVLIYVSGLLRELNDKGVQYTPPEPGVLDTDPNIQAIRGKK